MKLRVLLAQLLLLPSAIAAQEDVWETDFSKHTVPLEEIVPGGPSKDGIPAIDVPRFISATEADRWLGDREPVIVVEVGGDALAYPYQVIIWHEIVNDMVGGRPVVVTFCPLCNTALTFDRRHGGRTLEFGVTGMLRHSDLVMYDRQTESWWQQATGEAIVGRFAGETLRFVPSQTLRETSHDRPYGRNPYVGYDQGGGPPPSFFSGEADDRLPAVVVFWAPGTASALDRSTIAAGRAVDGPLQGTRLDPIPHGDYFWFAWAVFRPDTDVRR